MKTIKWYIIIIWWFMIAIYLFKASVLVWILFIIWTLAKMKVFS